MSRTMLAAFLALHASQNPTAPPVLQLSDADALALVNDEAVVPQLRHAEIVATRAEVLSKVGPPPGADQPDALEAWALARSRASADLWDALSGEEVDGVTIIRKRAATPPAPPETATATEEGPQS